MEIVSNIKLEEVLLIMEPEEDEDLDYAIEDLDGNWIMKDNLLMPDYCHVKRWKVEKIKIDPQGFVTFILNGGNFKEHQLRNVHEYTK